MKRVFAFFFLVACSAPTSEQPTSAIVPTSPATDTCDEAQFAGTFDFATVEHRGDSAYCEASAVAWNKTERPRSLRFWRELDGSWSSEYVDAPQAGITTYALDAKACALRSASSTRIFDKDAEAVTVGIPMEVALAVSLTSDGVAFDRADSLAAASTIQGLPCRITSTTAGVRR